MRKISKEESRRALEESRQLARQRDLLIQKQNSEMQRKNEQAVEGQPKTWQIQSRFQKKGIKRWQVNLYQGNYCLNEHTVDYTWDSRPTEDPERREYSNQAWSCSCGQPDCIHILKAKAYAKAHRKPTENEILAAERAADRLSQAQLDWLGRIWGSDPRFRAENGRLLTCQGRPATKKSDCVFDSGSDSGKDRIFAKKLLEPSCRKCAQHGCEHRRKHSDGHLGCDYKPSLLPAYAKIVEEAAVALPFNCDEQKALWKLHERIEKRMRA